MTKKPTNATALLVNHDAQAMAVAAASRGAMVQSWTWAELEERVRREGVQAVMVDLFGHTTPPPSQPPAAPKKAKLTTNDARVLRAVWTANDSLGGLMPHGPADWTAIRRLVKAQLVEVDNEWADCQTCPKSHEGPAYRLTLWGRRAVDELALQELAEGPRWHDSGDAT